MSTLGVPHGPKQNHRARVVLYLLKLIPVLAAPRSSTLQTKLFPNNKQVGLSLEGLFQHWWFCRKPTWAGGKCCWPDHKPWGGSVWTNPPQHEDTREEYKSGALWSQQSPLGWSPQRQILTVQQKPILAGRTATRPKPPWKLINLSRKG